ncbi:MAG: AI-2E family transporter [Flavobacteriales bacterium]|nr:MAG: AI-2E family transporter [Flavobacteriales bacterium]
MENYQFSTMSPKTKRVVGWLGLAIFIALIIAVWSIVKYILVAVVFTIILSPLMRLLDKVRVFKKPLNKNIRALIGIFTIFLVFGGIISIFAPKVLKEFQTISNIKLEDINESLEYPLQLVDEFVFKYNLSADENFNSKKYVEKEIFNLVGAGRVTSVFSNLASSIGNVFIAIFSVIFITFFFLREQALATNAIISITPDKFVPQVESILTKTRRSLSRYFIGVLIQVTLVATVVTTGLALFDIENALIIGVFAGMINIIPYLGPTLGAIFGIFVALTTNLDIDYSTQLVPFVMKIVSVFALVQMMDNFIFQPFIFSNSVNAHPLEIFLVIMAAASLAGISGMIVAVPTYAFLRIVLREFFSEFKAIREITKKVDEPHA